MMDPRFQPAERSPVKCMELNGIIYVPHYRQNGYAYPGIRKHDLPLSEYQLVQAGAKPVQEFLYESYGRGIKK
jgi:hypothetical protein